MDCREVQDQLIGFSENQLSRGEAERISGHLEICPDCREELRGIEKVMEGLKSVRLPEPGEAFWRDFPKRVTRAIYGEGRPVRVPILLRIWEGIYGAVRWFPLSKPVGAAVSIAAVALIIAGVLFFRAGPFWTGLREETLEGYFGGTEVVVLPFSSGLLETIPSSQLDDISKGLMGWLNGMGSAVEMLKGDEFLRGQDIFAQLEELNSEELDFVYDVLKTRFLKSTTSFSMPIG